MATEPPTRQSASSLASTTEKETEAFPSFSDQGSSLGITRTLTKRFQIRSVKASGPGGSGSYFNPTNIRMGVRWRGISNASSKSASSDIALLWRSRDNRKGRNSIAVPRITSEQASKEFPNGPPQLSTSFRQVLKGIAHMFTTFPYWDMPFWTAFWFNLGSLIWLVNSFFDWLPVAFPETEFEGETTYGYGITELLGVVAYGLGASMAYLEAVNYGSLYGSALRRLLDDSPDYQKAVVDEKLRTFVSNVIPLGRVTSRSNSASDRGRRNSIKVPVERRGAMDIGPSQERNRGYDSFRWVPTWQCLKAHHIHEIGFIACSIQFAGAFLFLVPGIVSLPGIDEKLKHWQKNAAYWIPALVASALFVCSSLLFMLENQDRYWKPKFNVIGWWIGFFALIGSVGFVISSALGPASYKNHKAEYQDTLCCLWGSLFFWFSSLLQQYESVNKNVVERLEETSHAHGASV